MSWNVPFRPSLKSSVECAIGGPVSFKHASSKWLYLLCKVAKWSCCNFNKFLSWLWTWSGRSSFKSKSFGMRSLLFLRPIFHPRSFAQSGSPLKWNMPTKAITVRGHWFWFNLPWNKSGDSFEEHSWYFESVRPFIFSISPLLSV